jgi:hypothetical protein
LNVSVEAEGDARALLAGRRGAGDFERGDQIAMFEAHPMFLALAPDRELEPLGQRVDDTDADAVEAADTL